MVICTAPRSTHLVVGVKLQERCQSLQQSQQLLSPCSCRRGFHILHKQASSNTSIPLDLQGADCECMRKLPPPSAEPNNSLLHTLLLAAGARATVTLRTAAHSQGSAALLLAAVIGRLSRMPRARRLLALTLSLSRSKASAAAWHLSVPVRTHDHTSFSLYSKVLP